MDNKKPKGLEEKMKEENKIAGGKISALPTANAGVLIRSNQDAFLIDSLYPEKETPPGFDFHYPSAKTLDMMAGGEPPFDGLSAYVFSHLHPDHGDTDVIARIKDKTVPVIVPYTADTPRVPDMEQKLREIESRVILLRAPIERHLVGNTTVIAIRTDHVGGSLYVIEHYCYIFMFPEGNVFFGGDTLMKDPDLVSFMTGYTKENYISAAFINYPEVARKSSRAFITEVLKPEELYLMHFPPGEGGIKLAVRNIECYKDILPKKIYLQNKPFTV